MDWSWADTRKILAILLVVASIGIVFLLVFHPLPPDAGNTFTLIGVLFGMTGSVATYYFGSSEKGEKRDDNRTEAVTKLVDHVVANGKKD